jgi:hypothetical protein
MSILTRLTAGSRLKDPREGTSTSPSEITIQDIGMAAGTLDWFLHDLVMQVHCDQTPPDLRKTLERVAGIFIKQWRLGKGPETLSRKRITLIARAVWQDFCTNQRMTDVERAKLCGMTDRNYRRGTHEAFRATLAELNTLAAKAYRDVKYQLRADI